MTHSSTLSEKHRNLEVIGSNEHRKSQIQKEKNI